MYPSKIIPNFLSDDEIALIERFTAEHGCSTIVGKPNNDFTHHAKIDSFFLPREEFQPIAEFLVPRIKQHFGEDIIIDDSTHILESYLPYGIHTDVATAGFEPNDKTDAAWTFIIPMADFDSHTVVFHQGHDYIKTVPEWIEQTGAQPHGLPVDPDLHANYLGHCDPAQLKYLTVEDMFPWKKGTLFAASRRKFHVSDNFPKKGLPYKRGIIMWSVRPKT